MDAATATELFAQHAAISAQAQQLWLALVLLAGSALAASLVMLGSVILIAKRQADLEAKFNLLIDVLLQTVQQNRARQENNT